MPRRYGTPFSPLARRPLLPRFHLPQGRAAWQASLRRGGTWARIVLLGGLLVVVISIASAVLAAPARPHLDVPGDPVILGTVVMERPRGWAMVAETPDLARPIVFFAPQADATLPPVTITIYAVDASDHYLAALTAAGNTSPSDYDLLVSLVTDYAREAQIPIPTMTRNTYNTSIDSSIVRVDLIATWSAPFAWKPAGAAAPSVTPSANPAGSSPTPGASPTVRPLSYPNLGETVAGQDMVVAQAYYLPDGTFFAGANQDGTVFRKMVVMTLSYPTSLDPQTAAEARTAFDRVASSISFGS